jgi:hypothetical protein
MSDAELEEIVKEALTQSGVTSKADIGKAMGAVMKAVTGRADGSRVKTLLESLLGVFVFSLVTSFALAQPAHAEIGSMVIPAFGSFSYLPYLEFGLRLVRVLFLWAGIFCLNSILHGSIKMSVDGSRDSDLHHAEHNILQGFVGITIVIGLFLVTTMMLGKLE